MYMLWWREKMAVGAAKRVSEGVEEVYIEREWEGNEFNFLIGFGG